jgi:hypothetical protein
MAEMKSVIDAMMDWERFVGNLFARLDGPFHFRIIMQPLMAAIFAVIDGVKDAKAARPPYFWSVVSDSKNRKELLKVCWRRVGKIFVLAVILDVIYSLKVIHWVYPGETLFVAFVLAIVPYLLLRGPIDRILKWRIKMKLKKSKPEIAAS